MADYGVSDSTPPFFFAAYVSEMTQLHRFLEFAWFGLERATDHAEFEQRILSPFLARAANTNIELFDALLPHVDVGAFAAEQKSKGFPILHQLCVVRLWTILETIVDDVVLRLLQHLPPMQLPQAVRNINAPIFDFLSADEESRSQFLLDCVKQDTRASLKQGVGRFEAMLGAVGFDGPIEDSVRRVLLELSEVRNVFVHRSGKVDARLTKNCPWLGLSVGDIVNLKRDAFERYQTAVNWYAFEVLDRVLDWTIDPSAEQSLAAAHLALAGRKAEFVALLGSSDAQGARAGAVG